MPPLCFASMWYRRKTFWDGLRVVTEECNIGQNLERFRTKSAVRCCVCRKKAKSVVAFRRAWSGWQEGRISVLHQRVMQGAPFMPVPGICEISTPPGPGQTPWVAVPAGDHQTWRQLIGGERQALFGCSAPKCSQRLLVLRCSPAEHGVSREIRNKVARHFVALRRRHVLFRLFFLLPSAVSFFLSFHLQPDATGLRGFDCRQTGKPLLDPTRA